MPEVKQVIRSALLPALQLSLGLFLIMKTTPLWAVVHCTIAYLLDRIHFPYTDYKQLREFQGRVFKKVISHATTAGDVSKVKMYNKLDPKYWSRSDMNAESHEIKLKLNYLGKSFELERPLGGMKMQVRVNGFMDGPAYYITDKMWEHLKYIEKAAADGPGTVFVKNNKEIWEEVVTGDIMEFEEVLDSVILDNRAVVRLDHDYFLPVNLLLAEDKLRASLNFVGIFLQTQKQVYWAISASLSLTAAVMGFSTTLRLAIIGRIDKFICRGVQFLCDLLPLAMRRSIYSWTSWVPGLKPSNDFQAKIIKGNHDDDVQLMLVAGGAKFLSQSHLDRITFADSSVDALCSTGGPVLIVCDPDCTGRSNCDSEYDKVYIEWMFDNTKCSLKAGRVALSSQLYSKLTKIETCVVCGERESVFFRYDDSHSHDVALKIDSCQKNIKESVVADCIHTASVDIDCSTQEEARKLFIFACSMVVLKSGSLKSYDSKSRDVYVRRFVESINAYVRSGYPALHKLQLKGVVVR